MDGCRRDIKILKKNLQVIPREWDGKECILELKRADYQWRQMEWWAFYFEYKARKILEEKMDIPGDRIGNVTFDLKGQINWDLKASAIKTHSHSIILNDKEAMDKSAEKHGYHGEIIALCDVEYNDKNRSFQKWHTNLKGGKSNYEVEREARTPFSRYRKTKAMLEEILLIILKPEDLKDLPLMRQGRNSDGSRRKVKYMLDLENLKGFRCCKISF
jgi:hypothetical protein